MVSRGIFGVIALGTVLLAAPPAGADATLVVQGSDGLQSMIQLRQGKGRVSAAGRDEYLIYDGVGGTITYVEPALRQYTQVTRDELKAGLETAAGIKQAVAPYMADVLAGLSPAQRRMIEQRLGALPSAPAAGGGNPGDGISTVARGSHTIAGLNCRASGIVRNGRPSAEVCMATQASGKLSRQDFATLHEMVTLSRSLAASAGGMLNDFARQLEFLSIDIDGVPLAVRDLEHGKRYQVTGVSDGELSDELFGGYGNFSKRDMPVF